MTCYDSKTKVLLAWLGSAAFIGLGFYLTILPGEPIENASPKLIGWLSVLFFGFCFIVLSFRGFRSGKPLVINEEGIIDHRTTFGFIPWSDITGIWVKATYRQSVEVYRQLCIDTTNPEVYLSKLSAFTRMQYRRAGSKSIIISVSTLDRSCDEIVNFIRSQHPEKFK